MLLTAIEVAQVRTLDVYEKQDLADTIIYQGKQLKAKDREILALVHRVADITKENVEANNRIAELEERDKILCKALKESDEDSNATTQKWIAETKILLDEKTALLAKVAELEAKLKPKSCVECKYSREWLSDMFECLELSCEDSTGNMKYLEVDKSFYCSCYTPKERGGDRDTATS